MWGPPPPRLTLRRAVERWGGLDVPYEVATARVLLAQACRKAGDQDGAARSMAIARELFDRIGSVNATGAARSALPGGLSEREAEVLRLVAAGRTNSDIARQFTSVSRAWRATCRTSSSRSASRPVPRHRLRIRAPPRRQSARPSSRVGRITHRDLRAEMGTAADERAMRSTAH